MESLKNDINKLQELTGIPYDICYKVFLDKNKNFNEALEFIKNHLDNTKNLSNLLKDNE